MDCRASLAMTVGGHGLPRFARNDDAGDMDCRAALAMTNTGRHCEERQRRGNPLVIALVAVFAINLALR
jgi:hypothetical protein